MKKLIAVTLALCGPAAFAQMTPVGLWRSVDDKTGEPQVEIRIVDQDGKLSGRIERDLKKGAKATCVKCKDERKGQPIEGLEIVRNAQKAEGKDAWEGGKILDPEDGREYSLKLTPVEGGKKLEVRGSVGPIGRTQTWLRVQ